MKWIVGIPVAFSCFSTPKLKSGASIPKNALGRCSSKSLTKERLSERMAGNCLIAST